jgi:hypothetical protein
MVPAGAKSQILLKTHLEPLKDENGNCYLSLYSGELSQPVIAENMAKIKAAFPGLPVGFYAILAERLKEKNFCNDRLKDAVNHVIETCIYPQPTIANFLSFDKRKKLFTYDDMLKKVHENGSAIWQYHESIKINGLTYWCEKVKEV